MSNRLGPGQAPLTTSQVILDFILFGDVLHRTLIVPYVSVFIANSLGIFTNACTRAVRFFPDRLTADEFTLIIDPLFKRRARILGFICVLFQISLCKVIKG